MSTLLTYRALSRSSDGADAQSRLEARLPPLLSVIAGMVDLMGFFMLGHVFTAHVTGNLVVAAAVVVGGGPVVATQMLAIPVFMLALAAVWWIAQLSDRRGPPLARLLLLVQFVLLAAVLIFSVAEKASASPHGVAAGVIVMLCVCAMACQYALLRLACPTVVSTAVMTGNLTNAVLALMELSSRRPRLLPGDADRLKQSPYLLGGFLLGCVVAAAAVSALGDWAWTLPVVLAGGALAVR
jgi:uncharacterized membrane protein YoaK (UPF0700 family)